MYEPLLSDRNLDLEEEIKQKRKEYNQMYISVYKNLKKLFEKENQEKYITVMMEIKEMHTELLEQLDKQLQNREQKPPDNKGCILN